MISKDRSFPTTAASLVKKITKPICELRLVLLVKELSIKTNNLAVTRSIAIYVRLWLALSNCYYIRLLRALIALLFGFLNYTAIEQSKKASG